MRRRLALLLAVAALAGAAFATPPDEGAFTEAMAGRIGAELGREVRVAGPLDLRLLDASGGAPTQVYLDRVWNVCSGGTDEACEETATRFIAALRETSAEPLPIAGGQLRLMVRSAQYCARVQRLFAESGQESPLVRDGPADLCTLLVADYPTTMRVLLRDALPASLPGVDEAWALAARQTLDNLPDPRTLSVADGVIIVAGLDYAPSLVLNEAGWRALAAAQGEILMAVPEDGHVLVARAADIDPARLRGAIREGSGAAERPISLNVYRWTDRGWSIVPE
jgi:hypothetical protein